MGCDIHMFIEVRKSESEPWQLQQLPAYGDRNYNTFAVLANVRNGHGFGADVMGTAFDPIAMPRGLPSDMSDDLKRIAAEKDDEDWKALDSKYGASWLGDHSHSWLTLAELLACDTSRATVQLGVVNPRQFKAFCKSGQPDAGYCGGISGSSVRTIDPGAMIAVVQNATMDERGAIIALADDWHLQKNLERYGLTPADVVVRGERAAVSLYTHVTWRETYAESTGKFFTDFVPKLRELGEPNNVRIVFGFDS